MGGHEDGIMAIAATADAAGQALLRALALAGQPPGGSEAASNSP
jgi:hypothetical protein